MLSKSEIPGKHQPRKQLSVRSDSHLRQWPRNLSKRTKARLQKSRRNKVQEAKPEAVGDGGHRGCMIISATHAFYILPNWGCESLASDDIISSLLVSYSQLWEYVDTNPSTSEKLAPTKVVEWVCGLSEPVPIVLRHLNTGGVALLEEVRHSLGQGRVQATVCFLCIPFSLCSLLAVRLVSSQWLLTSTLSCQDGLLSLWNPHAK